MDPNDSKCTYSSSCNSYISCMRKRVIAIFIICILLGFMLINPKEAMEGSKNGLLIWFHSVVPVLLPFMVLSRMLIEFQGFSGVIHILNPFVRKIWGLSPMGTYGLLLGFLSGYPMGAKIAADLVREQKITTEEGNYLLTFCNNVSPAFLIGFVLTDQLNARELVPVSIFLIYGIPLVLAFLWKNKRKHTIINNPLNTEIQASGFQNSLKIVDACIMNGLENILKLGCYIILFSIMAKLTVTLPVRKPLIIGSCIGFLEITNGIFAVSQLKYDLFYRYLLITAFLAFGGLSGTMQTFSMIQGSGLSGKAYLKYKCITTGVIMLILAMIMKLLPMLLSCC